jgi:hypothetical protein
MFYLALCPRALYEHGPIDGHRGTCHSFFPILKMCITAEVKYKKFCDEYSSFLRAVWRGGFNTRPIVTVMFVAKARRLLHGINSFSKGKEYSDMPASAHIAFMVLKRYIKHANNFADGLCESINPIPMLNVAPEELRVDDAREDVQGN